MTRVGHALLALVGGACLTVGCSGSSARDQNFGTDAANGFTPPTYDGPVDTGDTGSTATAGTGGTAGASGGAAGSTTDAGADVLSDGGPG